ncbi:hypothetical protein [Mycobacterium paraseoulense]|uniref:hypothetical protein n=1 Tax=Mycobacterium paraseoulense TaxID=590652 RepID=UPI001301E7B9|nr:hypothetical protein [Mycobacterium paraseoulense]
MNLGADDEVRESGRGGVEPLNLGADDEVRESGRGGVESLNLGADDEVRESGRAIGDRAAEPNTLTDSRTEHRQ